ncbi:ArsR/SmtB family transcription factor [Massilia sp.]|uniref:ArsR/SmtB family transcription factor n=1 Tax=Massilia sp. TaxID=1882437 RepID=UPI00352E1F05
MTIIDDLEQWGYSPANLPPQLFSVLADKVADTLFAPHAEPALNLRQDLDHLLDRVLESSPQILSTLTSSSEHPDHRRAYQIGQLSFAQRLATRQAERKLRHEFYQEAQSEHYFVYLRFLLQGEHSNAEIAERLSQRPETVSRKLKVLRGWGLTEFRRDGKEVINFLTIAGREFVAQKNEIIDTDNAATALSEVLKGMKETSSPQFKDHTTFAVESHPVIWAE